MELDRIIYLYGIYLYEIHISAIHNVRIYLIDLRRYFHIGEVITFMGIIY